MIYDILKNYMSADEYKRRFIPLDVDVLSPDCYLYLYSSSLGWFVIMEVDHPFLDEVVDAIESSFPVKVKGWRTLLSNREGADTDLLPRETFLDGELSRRGAVMYGKGMEYALLEVEPDPGVDEKYFGLSFYENH